MSETLDNIRRQNGIVPNPKTSFLLKVIDLLQDQLAAQQIARLDPDNELDSCWCVQEIVDDAGSTIVSQYTPQCPVHGR